MTSKNFTFTTLHLDDSVLVTLHGGIDHRAGPALDALIGGLPERLSSLVVEACDVPFMDATGMRFLLRLQRLAARRRFDLHSRGWQAQPGQLYDLAAHLQGSRAGETSPAVDEGRRQLRTHLELRSLQHRAHGARQALRTPPQ
ncbi:hypothetical protein QNO07_20740 [Streptomyces sp. 549]|uniref:hypothetical protein n=1 Tax=Streptomyces sp. 549 TaxID=3049076 RepID=UPI0024C2D79D|nr:hypothetical protein [Streptomyces sp. 549]MDK1475815.1 hypothetical protein [Streptomyces sp. 549]